MPIRAIIFDCFGVLLANTLQYWTDQLSDADAETFHALTRAADAGIISEQEATKERAALLGIPTDELAQGFYQGEVPNTALIEAIRTLKKQYKIGLLSNISSRERIESRLPEGLLDELFDSITVSGEVGAIKPDAQIYQYAAHSLGVLPEECIMVDDIEEFCHGAEAIGMQSIHFRTTAQALDELRRHLD